MKTKMTPITTFKGIIESVSIREVINYRVFNCRVVWWKPWTWLRRKIYLTYNPAIHPCPHGREIEPLRPGSIPHDWEGKRWVVTDNAGFKRLIFRDCVTPESLYQLGFRGDYDAIIIYPYDND